MGFSRQEYWSGLPFPSPGDLPDPGIEPGDPVLRANSLPIEPPGIAPSKVGVYSILKFLDPNLFDKLSSRKNLNNNERTIPTPQARVNYSQAGPVKG